jgi:hypothetical protein
MFRGGTDPIVYTQYYYRIGIVMDEPKPDRVKGVSVIFSAYSGHNQNIYAAILDRRKHIKSSEYQDLLALGDKYMCDSYHAYGANLLVSNLNEYISKGSQAYLHLKIWKTPHVGMEMEHGDLILGVNEAIRRYRLDQYMVRATPVN